jgi:hypothetical protein
MADRTSTTTGPTALGGSASARGVRSMPEDSARPGPGTVLFEIAWEVCNQVGGIYQVLRSKAATIEERWKDR